MVPTWFEWDGTEIVMATYVAGSRRRHPSSRRPHRGPPGESGGRADDRHRGLPAQSLTIRGRAEIDEVDGLAPEYVASARRYLGDDGAAEWSPRMDQPGTVQARIAVRPTWVGLLDFATRLSRSARWCAGMSSVVNKVISGLSVSVDGYITGRDPGPGRGLGDGAMLFDWYFDGDTPSGVFDGFRLSEASARLFDALAGRVGASLAGRNTYDDSDGFGGGGPHPTAPLFVLTHRPAPAMTDRQTLVTTGIEDAVVAARDAAGDKDVALMGGGVVTEALQAGLVDEVVLHQVPILLGGGRPFFREMPEHVALRLVDAVPAPGVTHLHYEVVR